MLNKRTTLALLGTLVLALPLAARAQSTKQLESKFSTFAGSEANSKSLVTGLRNGTQVTLTDGQTTTIFTPPTGKMGNGNVNIALSLAEASLKQQNVSSPTPDQLKTTLSGILQQRAEHKGWGEIANSMGFKLGDVMRSEKADKVAQDRKAREERTTREERPVRPEVPQRGR